MVAFVIDQLISEEKASIGINDLSIQRGYGIFDFFRTVNHVPLFLDDHLDRFFNSATELRLQPLQKRDEIRDIIARMMKLNNIGMSGFKLILTGGYSTDSFHPASPNLVITQQPIHLTTTEQFEAGIEIILHEYMRDLPYAKSINYLMSIYLSEKLINAGAKDVLYHKEGKVLEFPRANIFVVTKDGTVVTPAQNVLQGITRKKLLAIARAAYKTEERTITLEELSNASEVFLTSTTKRILPVVSIDHQQIGDGKPGHFTRSLYCSFLKAEEAYVKLSKKI